MQELTLLGKLLIVAGAVLAGIGVILVWGGRLSFLGLGKLPGDILVRGKHGAFYFPIVTCLVLSALLSLVLWLVSTLGRR